MREIRVFALGLVVALAIPVATAEARPRPAPKAFYGVVSQSRGFSDEEVGKLRRGRVGTIRFVIPWQRVERERGSYDWSVSDAKLEAISRARARPIPVLFGQPAWLGDGRAAPLGSLEAEHAWQDFATAAVRRYGAGGTFIEEHPGVEPVAAWQVWNEPNLPSFWGDSTPVAREYVTLLRLSVLAIRDADPDAEIILAGLSPGPKGVPPPRYLREVYAIYEELAVEPDFDIVAVHPYASRVRESRRQVQRLVRAARAATGAKQRILIAEVGWGSGGPKRQLISGTRKKQAKRLTKAFKVFKRKRRGWRIESVLWYAWRDIAKDQAACVFCTHVGLFRANGRAKPAWDAFRRASGAR